MAVDYSDLLYDPVFAALGVPATMTTGTADEATLTVIDDTRPKTNTSGSGEILSVGPGAFVRMPELTDNGIAREDLVDSVLTFNGRNWRILASEPRGSPNGEDVGELRLLLKALGRPMVDVREDILARLLEVVAAIPNIRSAHRNKAISDETELPTVIVYDGDEEPSRAPDLGSRPPNAPTVMHMTPEIAIAQQADNIGSDLTAFRSELIKLVLYDVTLNEQVVKTGRHGNGVIRYLGCETQISTARAPFGAVLARFLFSYSLKPDDL